MSIPKYILFDVENVLFPATELYLDSLKIVLAKSTNGKYILKTDALMASEFGTMSYSDVFDFLHTGTGFARFTSDQKAVLANRLFVQTEYLIQHSDLIKTRNESLELFRWLTDSGFKLAICTNLPQSILRLEWRQQRRVFIFKAIFTYVTVVYIQMHGKPQFQNDIW